MRRYAMRWRVGPTADTTEADRWTRTPARHFAPSGRADLYMDLQADKKVALSIQWADEVGNPVDAPGDSTVVYTVDDTSVINLTDNGDGTAVAAATGTLGTANVHAEITAGDLSLTGDLQLVVVAGLAERVNISAGDPEEVTPDA